MSEKPLLTVVLGPTASGKTDYAIEIAKQKNGQIISADSRQVYRGMDIGTAKVRDTHSIPHHLIDIRNPNEPLSLSEWQQLAFEVIGSILAEGKQPILAGGTMLYIDSVVFNFDIPRVRPNDSFRAEKEAIQITELYQELLRKDPEAKNFIEPGNTRRIVRALEVLEATGKPFSEQRKQQEPKYSVKIIGLFPGWENLKQRIEIRSEKMLAEGLLEETKALRKKYGDGLPLLQTLNYRQAGAVLDKTMSRETAAASMVQDTMRYAHRQMSWWKNRGDITWISY